jgi:HlyD family secretion protein
LAGRSLSSGRPGARPGRPHGWSSQRKLFTGGAALVIFLGTAVGVLAWTGTIFGKAVYTGPTFTVRKEKLKVTVVSRGSLESASNGDIYCRVRSGTKGSTIATTIKTVVDAGTKVEEGEEVMVLDFSGFEEQKKDKIKDVKQAYAAKVQSEQQVEIQKLDNDNDILKAKNQLDLAKTDLKKYIEGDYPQALHDVEGRIETSSSDLDSWKDRAAWSARMVKKGLMSKVQADADKDRENGSAIALKKVQEEKDVLVKFTYKRTVDDLTSKVKEAQNLYDKTKIQAEQKIEYLQADFETKKAIYDLEVTRLAEIDQQIDNCKIRSPQSGLVVYYVPDQVRGGGGAQQSIIAQGEPVREGQKLMQIPDLDDMIVNVRVPEAFIQHLKSERKDPSKWQRATIKVDAFQSRLLQGHVTWVDTVASTQDWFAADVKVYKTLVSIDIHCTITDSVLAELANEKVTDGIAGRPTSPHLPTRVFVGAEKMPKEVIAKLAALKDHEYPSRKQFETELAKVLNKEEYANFHAVIFKRAKDRSMPSLKPGMSAEVTITAEETTEPVVVVPVQTVVGTISKGANRSCFVVGPDGTVSKRDIVVSRSNERLVEVIEGLEAGEKVVEDPRPFIKDTDLKPGKARGGPGDDSPGGGDKGGKGGTGKGGAPGGGKGGGAPKSVGLLLQPDLPPPARAEAAWVRVEQPAVSRL